MPGNPEPDPAAPPKKKKPKATLAPRASRLAPDLAADLFQANATRVDTTIIELATGIKVALPYKKRKLTRGESEWELTTDSGTVWVYEQPPNTSLLKLIAEQNRGKAQAKEAKALATTLVLKVAVPGMDSDVDAYLASLPDETLARYALDEPTLTRLRSLRAS